MSGNAAFLSNLTCFIDVRRPLSICKALAGRFKLKVIIRIKLLLKPFEGLFDGGITLSSQEWESAVENKLDSTTPEVQIIHYLAHMPDIMQRGRHILSGMYNDPDFNK